jgi:hypothetical protein
MSQNTIDLEFGDGSYTFALPLAQIAELQRKTGVGIGGLFSRVLKGCFETGGKVYVDPANAQFYALDIIETIRHGLVGGGKGMVNGEEIEVKPPLANRLVDTYVMGNPLKDSWSLATSILGACIVGYDPPKKELPPSPGAKKKTPKATSTTARSAPTA